MAQVYLTRGDLDRALALYQESLQLLEQLGDKKGKAASLSNMSNVYWELKDFAQAQSLMEQSILLSKQMGDFQGTAYSITKLGQLCQVRGDNEAALKHYLEGLDLFEHLGAQPMFMQVKQLIASLESNASPASAERPASDGDPLAQVISQARAAHQRGEIETAIQCQEQAVALARQTGQAREALVILSVLLYNLAGYYRQADRPAEAVRALEEVVALDEQTGHADLEADRQSLATARQSVSLPSEKRARLQQATSEPGIAENETPGFEAQLQAALAQVPAEQRAAAEAQMRQALEDFQRLSPEEQAGLVDAAQRQQAQAGTGIIPYEQAADQARAAALAYVRRQAPKHDVLAWLEQAASQAAEGEDPGSPWLAVAGLCLALAALIKQEPLPPVPVQYAAHFSAVQAEFKPQ